MKLKPYKPIPKHNTDWLTYAVRFVCGALFGVIVGASMSSRLELHKVPAVPGEVEVSFQHYFILIVFGCSMLFGLLAAIFGDRFWGMIGHR